MKLENTELLVAAQVLELAASHRQMAWARYARENDLPAQASPKERKAWRDEHPVSEFVPGALASLQAVAMQIREITAASNRDPAKG